MKKLPLLLLFLTGCIQTDLEDPFDPTLRIDNSIAEIDFRVSGTYALSAVYTDDTGEPTDQLVTWESSNNSILSFDENAATVHEEGLVIITVHANGLEATEAIQTLPSRGSLQISGYTPKLQSGNATPFQFNFIDLEGNTDNNVNAQWSSLDEGIATISAAGTVSAISAGSTDISISFNGVNNTVKLEVSDDPVMLDPILRMVQFAQFLTEEDEFTFRADYYDENGLVDEDAAITWSSSDGSILSVDENGLAVAHGPGTAAIRADFQNTSASMEITIEAANNNAERSGSLMGTGYSIEGDFTLSENEDGDLILTITNYSPDGPGPYFYLTNQSSNVANGLSLGDARTSGDITINVSDIDSSVELNTYNFLMIWCEPFSVRLGFGEFDN